MVVQVGLAFICPEREADYNWSIFAVGMSI